MNRSGIWRCNLTQNCLCFFIFCVIFSNCQGNQNALNITIAPMGLTDESFEILWKKDVVKKLNISSHFAPEDSDFSLEVVSADDDILSIQENARFKLSPLSNSVVNITIRGLTLGRTYLQYQVNIPSLQTKEDNSSFSVKLQYETAVIVTREDSSLNTVFTVLVIVLVCAANVAMGCKTELPVVKATFKKPIGPLTGMFSQFILMPLISFVVGIALDLSPPLAFGFFTMGCSPGGAASNIYTYYLDGNVSLSVTMTFVSTLVCMALIPLWLYTLGINVIYHAQKIKIPFSNIVFSILGLVIPVGIGLFIQWKKPAWAKVILKSLRYITVLFIILIFTLGVYANLYVFSHISPLVAISGALVPYCGFLFGGFVAFVTKRPKADILTIAIETGIQNTGIAIVLLQLSLPKPDSDISIVAPIIGAIFTPIPLAIALLVYCLRKKFSKQKDNDESIVEDQAQKNDDFSNLNSQL